MANGIFWNRRSGFDRRIFNTDPDLDFRGLDRRNSDSKDYVLVMGSGGIDAFGLVIALPVLALIIVAITGNFFAT
jgi:hypothetical protein